VVLLTGNHPASNPRVVKEADAFTEAGYEVTVVGGAFLPEMNARDEKIVQGRGWSYRKAYDLTCGGPGPFLLKLQRKLGELAWRNLGLANQWQLFYGTGRLLKEAFDIDANLTIAHWEPALPAAVELMKRGTKVGVDMEDWFSEDLLPEARRTRPIRLLKQLEKNLLCHGVHSTCTSEAMADALVKAYGCRRPTVIRNVFPLKDRESIDRKWKDRPAMAKWMPSNDPQVARPKEAPVSIHWFSQTIGPGRGLETLFRALDGLEGDWELHLRGNLKGYEPWLERACSAFVKERVKVHRQVENEELPSRIAEHDIGFAGELPEPLSRNLTITNKFFQYLQAGLAVVASDTAGQIEGASEAGGAVWVFPSGGRVSLAEKVGGLLRDRGALQKTRQFAWQAGARLTWENESQRILATLP
jgi:glycosyltransferase involved in cell wall biosynthesis